MWILTIDFVLWITSMILGLIVLQTKNYTMMGVIMFVWSGLTDLGTIALCFAFAGYWDEIKAWCGKNLSG